MAEGAILGSYQFTTYRSDISTGKDLTAMTILAPQKGQLGELTEGIRRGVATAEATVFVRDLCNHPSNVMTPTRIANEAKTVAKEAGVSLKVLEQKDMETLGMGALLGVAKGSHEPPKFMILQYHGAKKKDDRPVVLVGKTITFDTGGISAQAGGEYGADEGRHDRWSGGVGRDAGGGSAEVTSSILSVSCPLRKICPEDGRCDPVMSSRPFRGKPWRCRTPTPRGA